MRRRWSFYGRSAMKGAAWLLTLSDLWLKVVAAAGIAGVTIGAIKAKHFPSWVVAVVVAVVVIAALAQGAYQEWELADNRPSGPPAPGQLISGPTITFGSGGITDLRGATLNADKIVFESPPPSPPSPPTPPSQDP